MDLLEHQGKELFERHGIKLIPRGVAASAAEAREAAGRLGPVAMTSSEGGIDIEEVAATRPEAIRRAAIDPLLGLKPFHVRRLVGGFPEDARDGAGALLERIYEVLITNDATLVEVNPLAVLKDGRVVPLDAKVTIDDNALYRHPDLAEYASAFPLEPTEARAREWPGPPAGMRGGPVGPGPRRFTLGSPPPPPCSRRPAWPWRRPPDGGPPRGRHAGGGPGHHREGRAVPHAPEPRLRHERRGRRHAGQGRRGRRGDPGVRFGG